MVQLMKATCFLAVLAMLSFSGCSTPGSQYAKDHPELSPAHRQILQTGEIPGGLAVDGMTKEQIRLAKGNPTRSETLNGQDVWVYVHERFSDMASRDDRSSPFNSGMSSQRTLRETANLGSHHSVNEVTTIFFQENRATYTKLSRERR